MTDPIQRKQKRVFVACRPLDLSRVFEWLGQKVKRCGLASSSLREYASQLVLNECQSTLHLAPYPDGQRPTRRPAGHNESPGIHGGHLLPAIEHQSPTGPLSLQNGWIASGAGLLVDQLWDHTLICLLLHCSETPQIRSNSRYGERRHHCTSGTGTGWILQSIQASTMS